MMHVCSMKCVVVTMLLTGTHAVWAGPSFNSYRDDLQKQSREAGRLLQEGFALYHNMLSALESNDLLAAKGWQLKAADKYTAAIEQYQQLVERTPKQPLSLDKNDKVQSEASGRLKNKLSVRKVAFPETERDLAELAVKCVTELRAALVETELTGAKRDLPGLMKLTLQNTFVEEVGVFASIIWAGPNGTEK